MNFHNITYQLTSLSLSLNRLNPNRESEHEIIFDQTGAAYAKSVLYRTPTENRIFCNSLGGQMLDLQTFTERRLSSSDKIMFSDYLRIEIPPAFRCEFMGKIETGLQCVKSYANLAKKTSLERNEAHLSNADFYVYYTTYHLGQVLFLTKNGTEIKLDENPMHTVMCSLPYPGNSDNVTHIVQQKFFNHLTQIYGELIDTMMDKNDVLQNSLLLLMDKGDYGHTRPLTTIERCHKLQSWFPKEEYQLEKTRNNGLQNWMDRHISNIQNINENLLEIKKILISFCSTLSTKDLPLISLYNAILSFHINLVDVIKVFASHIKKENFQFKQPPLFDPKDINGQTYQTYLEKLFETNLDEESLKFLITRFENEKFYLLQKTKIYLPDQLKPMHPLRFSDLSSNQEQQILREMINKTKTPQANKVDRASEGQRIKRSWIGQYIASITGLVPEEDIEKVSRNEEKLLQKENEIVGEIRKIETKSNKILNAIKEQDKKFNTLYKDEQRLQETLMELLKEETKDVAYLVEITRSLEVLSDVILEFQGFHNQLMLLPLLLEEAEEGLLAVLSQTLYPSLLPEDFMKSHLLDFGSFAFQNPKIKTYMNPEGIFISLTIPEFHPTFTLFRIKGIPFWSKNSFFEIRPESEFVASNKLGHFFDYEEKGCKHVKNGLLCLQNYFNIRKKPDNCGHELAVGRYGKACTESIYAIPAPNFQNYFEDPESNIVTISAFYPDKAIKTCGTTHSSYNITRGLTLISLEGDCYIETSELYIYPSHVEHTRFLMGHSKLDLASISNELGELAGDLSLIHTTNLSLLIENFQKYSEATGIENLALRDAEKELEKFQALEDLKNFTTLALHLEKVTEESSSLAITATLITICISITILLCCVMICAPCNKCFFSSIGFIFKLIFSILKIISCGIVNCIQENIIMKKSSQNYPEEDLPSKSKKNKKITKTEPTKKEEETTLRSTSTMGNKRETLSLPELRKDPFLNYSTIDHSRKTPVRSNIRTSYSKKEERVHFHHDSPKFSYNYDLNSFNKIPWVIEKEPDGRLVLSKTVDRLKITYDVLSQQSISQNGLIVNILNPDRTTIDDYFSEINKQEAPSLIYRGADLSLDGNPEVLYDPEKRLFKSKTNGKILLGYNQPTDIYSKV